MSPQRQKSHNTRAGRKLTDQYHYESGPPRSEFWSQRRTQPANRTAPDRKWVDALLTKRPDYLSSVLSHHLKLKPDRWSALLGRITPSTLSVPCRRGPAFQIQKSGCALSGGLGLTHEHCRDTLTTQESLVPPHLEGGAVATAAR